MKNRHLFLTTTMLISPTLFAMGGFNAAKADCSVTAGTGSVASPDNGDTITCSVAGGDQTSVVGDGTPGVFATINLDAGANINVSGDYAVDLESAVITLGNSATIQSDDNNTIRANEANALLNINLGESSSIRNTSGKAIYVYDDTTTIPNGDSLTVTLSGDNSEINSNDDSVYAYFIDKVSIELAGDNSRLDSSGGNAVYQRYGSQNLDLSGDSSYLASSNNTAVYTYDTDTFITLSGDNTYITGRTGVRVYDYFGSYDLSVTLSGDDASIIGVNNFGIDAYSYNGMDGVVTLSGDNTNITGATQGILFYANNYQPGYDNDLTVLLSGDGSSITSTAGDGIYVKSYGYNQSGDTNLTLTLSGDGANIASASGDGVFVSSYGYNYFGNPITNANAAVDINLSEENTYILGGSSGIKIDAKNDATVNITLSHSNTSITGSSNDGVYINSYGYDSTGNAETTIDTAGTISGANNAIYVSGVSEDTFTLRTGSNLIAGTYGIDSGDGNDTLILDGNGTEDEDFLNIETLEVNANVTGWELTSPNTSFNDINVNSGLFINNGGLSATNAITINAGATLGGAGTMTGNVINNGAISPGNSVGTQTITGNFSQGAGGSLNIEFDNTGIDLLDISGTANIDGTLNLNQIGLGVTTGAPLVFIDADGGLAGTFSTVNETFLMGDGLGQAILGYNANQAFVTFGAVSSAADVLGVDDNLTKDELNIITALDNTIVQDPANATLILNALGDAENISNALTSQTNLVAMNAVHSVQTSNSKIMSIIKGRNYFNGLKRFVTSKFSSLHSSNSQFAYREKNTDQSIKVKNKTLINKQGNKKNYSQPKSVNTSMNKVAHSTLQENTQKNMWSEGFGSITEVDGDRNARGFESKAYGFAVGGDLFYKNIDTSIGTFVSYSHTDGKVDGLQDTSDSDIYQIGVYGSKIYDDIHLSGSLSLGYMDFETKRITTQGNAKGDFDGYGGFGYIEASYNAYSDLKRNILYTPFIGLDSSVVYQDSYRETGAGVLNLDVDSQTTKKLSTTLGMQVDSNFLISNYEFKPTFRVGWEHEFLDNGSEVSANFSGVSSSSFAAESPEQNRDSLRLNLDLLSGNIENNTDFYVSYDSNIASDFQTHAVKIGLKYSW